MTRFLCAVLLGIFAAAVSSGQVVGTLRTGFAVITPLTSDSSVFSVSETFTERFQGNLLQSSVTPSPLVTLTSMVINLDPASGTNTGIAIVDPFDVPATVTLSLVNRQGITISARTIIVGGRQQRSRFVTELFSGLPELTASFTGQLFISSNVPVSILGVAFSGQFFTALPPPTQLRGNNIFAPAKVNSPGAPDVTASLVHATGAFDTGTPGTNFNPIAVDTALLLPQIVTGGGWASTITIANRSLSPQSVRVDFFDSFGGPFALPIASSFPNTVIQPGGVLIFSTLR